MTLLSVVNTGRVTLLTDELVVPADRIDAFDDLAEAARTLSALRDGERDRLAEAEREARERGHADGAAAADKRSAEQLAERLVTLEGRVEREREALRVRTTDIALRIVRRVAASLGEEATLAALAREAARELLPSARIVVQVHPERLEGVRERLGAAADGRTRSLDTELVVEAEESLATDQCRLRSSGGIAVLAGLETQLGAIERRAASRSAANAEPSEDGRAREASPTAAARAGGDVASGGAEEAAPP